MRIELAEMGMESPETAQQADDSYRVSSAVGVCPEPAAMAGFFLGGRKNDSSNIRAEC
jgi:hypothetical protein